MCKVWYWINLVGITLLQMIFLLFSEENFFSEYVLNCFVNHSADPFEILDTTFLFCHCGFFFIKIDWIWKWINNLHSVQVLTCRLLKFLIAHLSWKLKWAFLIACRPSVNFSHFHLLQNHCANFNQTWHKASFGEGDSNLLALFQGEIIVK